MDHHSMVCRKDTTLTLLKVTVTVDTDMADTDTWPLPILECRTMPQDLMDNHGSTSEDPVVNPLPTGLYTKAPTSVNYHPVTKVPRPHPSTAITLVWTTVSCGINNLCHSTMVNYHHLTDIITLNTK